MIETKPQKPYRISVKLNAVNTAWIADLARESAMNLTTHQISNCIMERSRDWAEANIARKSK